MNFLIFSIFNVIYIDYFYSDFTLKHNVLFIHKIRECLQKLHFKTVQVRPELYEANR